MTLLDEYLIEVNSQNILLTKVFSAAWTPTQP